MTEPEPKQEAETATGESKTTPDAPFDLDEMEPVPVSLPTEAPAPEPAKAAPAPAPAAPAPAAAPAPVAAKPAASPAKSSGKGKGKLSGFDALAELEKLRRQTLKPRPAKAAAPSVNGSREIKKDLSLDFDKEALGRARRFSLTLRLEDAAHQPLDSERQMHVEFDAESLDELMVRLNIALRTTP